MRAKVDVAVSREWISLLRTVMIFTSSLALAACSGESASVKFQPEFLPVEFSLDTDGKFAVDIDLFSYVTPIGRFTIDAGIEKELKEERTRLIIKREGATEEDIYDLDEMKSLAVCTDGRSEVVPQLPAITVTAYGDTTRIGVIDSSKTNCSVVYPAAKAGADAAGENPQDSVPPTRSGTVTIAEGHSVVLDTESPNWNANRGCGDCSLWFQGELSPGYGGDLAPLSSGEADTFATCEAATQYQGAIKNERIKRGMRVCVRTPQGNFALIKVVEFNDPEGYEDDYIKLDVKSWF